MPSLDNLAVVIPCYRVKKHILDVIAGIGPEVRSIIVVDDACPEATGAWVKIHATDPRLIVVTLPANHGVGGATLAGYRAALDLGAGIIVKMDGDGQMDPAYLQALIRPIVEGKADYSKGNRFFDLADLLGMPKLRIFGNAGLSLLSKLSSGYWNIFDPTNGYVAIHADVARSLPFDKIDRRYFFETDMLFRLNLLRAVVVDIPMRAVYGEETSNLKISRVLVEFPAKHARNFIKRIFYGYFLRDMSIASFELVLGVLLGLFGMIFGTAAWVRGSIAIQPASAGTVMLAGLPLLAGLQLLLAFLSYDITSTPRTPLQSVLHLPSNKPR